MVILKVLNRINCKLYKKRLEKIVGRKLKDVSVKGKLYFENNSIIIGNNVVLYPNITFSGDGKIIIGDNCKIGKDTIIYSNKNGGVSIGHHSIIAAQTYIIDTNHSTESDEYYSNQPLVSSKVFIGDNVWIGANCTIIKGAYIGNNVVIGAKSLVNKQIPENTLAFGVPAKVVKMLR